MPVRIRATTTVGNDRVIAETNIEFVSSLTTSTRWNRVFRSYRFLQCDGHLANLLRTNLTAVRNGLAGQYYSASLVLGTRPNNLVHPILPNCFRQLNAWRTLTTAATTIIRKQYSLLPNSIFGNSFLHSLIATSQGENCSRAWPFSGNEDSAHQFSIIFRCNFIHGGIRYSVFSSLSAVTSMKRPSP